MSKAKKEQEVDNKLILISFIKNNGLTFGDGRRNSDFVIISGYSLYLDIDEVDQVEEAIEEALSLPLDADVSGELYRVFEYAYDNNYGVWWTNPHNTKGYKM